MKRRLYFVLSNKRLAKEIERQLLLRRIEPNHIRFLARSDTSLSDLPSAGPMQTSDVRRGIKIGLLSGGLIGAATGLLLSLNTRLHIGAGLLIMTLVGALFGIWTASLIAASVPSKQLKAFEKDLRDDKILLMLDIPKERIKEITKLIMRHHPEADARGADPTIPAFP